MRSYYFISGMPRSGSTLLCNILAQNPKFFVSPATSGCHDVLFNIRNQWDRLLEHRAEGVDYTRLRRVMAAALNAYHETDKGIIIDKGRGWLSLIEMAEFVTESKCKVIVPVRELPEILASFEQLWRKTAGITQWEFEATDYFKAQTVEGRCDIWSSSEQPVGLAYNRIKDALSRGYADRMLFVDMDDLTRSPAESMQRIYDFIGQDRFEHNFENVEQITNEDDTNVHRIPDLHTIRPVVAPVPRRAVKLLGHSLVQKYANTELW